MLVNVAVPLTGVLPGLELGADEIEHGVKKGGGARGRIENEHAMRLVGDLAVAFLARE